MQIAFHVTIIRFVGQFLWVVVTSYSRFIKISLALHTQSRAVVTRLEFGSAVVTRERFVAGIAWAQPRLEKSRPGLQIQPGSSFDPGWYRCLYNRYLKDILLSLNYIVGIHYQLATVRLSKSIKFSDASRQRPFAAYRVFDAANDWIRFLFSARLTTKCCFTDTVIRPGILSGARKLWTI